ncbi:hypothetical protein TNCV_1006141 [Trichonephila clavipes]|nr:hypothetical protein TNCV_1006141 [Trichonephila clavipes]
MAAHFRSLKCRLYPKNPEQPHIAQYIIPIALREERALSTFSPDEDFTVITFPGESRLITEKSTSPIL